MRILYDLKAALDGYAGIPQETRLLFAGLRSLGGSVAVDGLLQHGHTALFADTGGRSAPLAPDQHVDRASRTIISFYTDLPTDRLRLYLLRASRYRAWLRLAGQALSGKTVGLGEFDGELFQDFLWTRLFDKTLDVSKKALVTGGGYRVASPPRGLMQYTGLKPLLPLTKPHFLKLDTTGYDFLVAQTPFPAHVAPGTRLLIRYHDAVPMLMPHTIGGKSLHQASHYRSLKANVEDGAIFACNSQATRRDLLRIFPELEDRAAVIHNMIGERFQIDDFPFEAALSVIATRAVTEEAVQRRQPQDVPRNYLLMVSTLEPRKNHALLIAAWERLKHAGMPDLALVLVGNKGWDFEPIEQLMRPWMQRGQLFHLSNVPTAELRILYRHAAATVCPSRGEGFDYSGIEAMASGGLVVASDIDVHREIYLDASAYFDPYSVTDAASTIARILGEDGQAERDALRRASPAVVDRYRVATILPQWQALLDRHRHGA